ncbi:toll/interleukin-1 receptor domain-containing protein [Cognatiyoonia sp. IB215446]|uniref:toll/interleukin-1 receptor domain-containing protein n=1 Tax=Cognatiyoonia sp. IB215446 TaxID=3097355 RepID=UPI002A130E26|nr:toll/interleukin-1 receptor domain-containing protein [Cognatiyoonia sp. IB215446]MDX8348902.1 toll/interleukin-1 receptor domain-containing protein [Cognatiyoonia sp. IB215446]
MRVSDKLALLDKIGRELQSRFTFSEIDAFLAEFQITRPENAERNSKWVYSKNVLSGLDDELIIKIAGELDLLEITSTGQHFEPPRNWQKTQEFRLFISHVAAEKLKATRLKDCLAKYGISGFVAHEDIHPTLEWQNEIERALHTMDAFVSIHTSGFSKSFWTPQEIGFAVGKAIKVISLRMGEDPTGFISKQQALSRGRKTAEEIADEIDQLLSDDPRTQQRLAEGNPKARIKSDRIERIAWQASISSSSSSGVTGNAPRFAAFAIWLRLLERRDWPKAPSTRASSVWSLIGL